MATPCSLDATFGQLLDAAHAGLPAVLLLADGYYTLDETFLFNGTISASAVRISGSNHTVLSPLHSGSALLVVEMGAPPVIIQSLTLRGQIQSIDAVELVLHDCNFDGHASIGAGAGMLVDGGAVEVHRTRFTRLTTQSDGGAVAIFSGSLALHGCTLVGNRARRGGALFASGGVLAVDACLVEGNEASVVGGGLAADGSPAVLLANSTRLRANTAPSGNALSIVGSASSFAYALHAPRGTWVASGSLCQQVYEGSALAPPQRQPCDWMRVSTMIGLTVSTLAPDTHEDADYPYECPPGIVGDSLETLAQTRPTCARPCPAQFYCPAGTVQPLPCAPGSYCPRGISWPLPCLPGSFSNATNLASASECTLSEPGFYASTGSVSQSPCAKGTFNHASRSGSCEQCPAGKYQGSVGQTACSTCPSGSYCEVGSTAHIKCDAGTFQDEAGQSSCSACPSGFACAAGASLPILCLAGSKANAASNASVCVLCLAGEYQDQTQQTSCRACEAGYSCAQGATHMTPCAKGSFTSASMLKDVCEPCIAGEFQLSERQTACSPCPAGSYCPTGAAAALPCDAGTYSNATKLTSPSDCMSAEVGFYAPAGSTVQFPCRPGTYSPMGGMADCLPCPGGTYRPGSESSLVDFEDGSGPAVQRGFVDVAQSGDDLQGALPSSAAELLTCLACEPGSFCPPGASAPLPCSEGTYSNANNLTSASQCAITEPGFYAPTGSVEKIACLAGTVAQGYRSSICTACSAGSFQRLTGQTACEICPSTSYCPQGTATPVVCPPGTANPREGAETSDACVPCQAGFWCAGGASVPCVKDTFNHLASNQSTDQSACYSCPGNSTTMQQENASHVTACRCNRDFFNSNATQGGVRCEPCPSGTSCGQGTTLESLPIKRGYYRRSARSVDIRRCPDAGTNCSSAPECEASTSGCRGSVEQVATTALEGDNRRLEERGDLTADALLCHEGLTGVFCMKCDRSNLSAATNVYYTAATEEARAACHPCADTLAVTILVVIGVLAIMAVVPVTLRRLYGRVSPQRQIQLLITWRAFEPFKKLKILVGFYMIASKVGSVYEVELPAQVKRLLATISLGVTFGFARVGTPLQCLGWHSYLNNLTFWMVAPVVAALAIVVVAVAIKLYTAASSPWLAGLESATPWVLRMLFLAYPLVTNVAFGDAPALPLEPPAVSCEAMPDCVMTDCDIESQSTAEAWPCYEFWAEFEVTGSSLGDGMENEHIVQGFLKADVDVRCGSDDHIRTQAIASAAVVLYAFGMIVLYASLLYLGRHAITTGRCETSLSRAIKFLYHEYKPDFFWWEIIEMLRRLVLVGGMVLMQGSTMQLIIGTLFSLMFMLFQLQVQPFTNMFDGYLATTCSFSLVVIFLCAYAFKEAMLLDLPDIQDKMSLEQLDVYVLNHQTLTFLLLIHVFGAILASAVLFMVQLAHEGRRLAKEARTAKARRLRVLADGSEVIAPKLSTDHLPEWAASKNILPNYLFLSHNWAQGQSDMRIVKQRLLEMVPDFRIFLDVDNLGTGTKHCAHIDISVAVMCFCTELFFKSGPCAQEVVRTVVQKKPVFILLEPDKARGGLTEAECRRVFADNPNWSTETKPRVGKLEAKLDDWKLEWQRPDLAMPTTAEIEAALFAQPLILWSRLSAFQDVSMRLIAERILQCCPSSASSVKKLLAGAKLALYPSERLHGTAAASMGSNGEDSVAAPVYGSEYVQMAYMQGEVAECVRQSPIKMAPFKNGRRFHLYCSASCQGAADVGEELRSIVPALKWTSSSEQLEACEQMLVYLTSATWTSGEASRIFAQEVCCAMRAGVRLMCAHETPGARLSDKRHSCTFSELLEWTPSHLLECKPGIYGAIALNLAEHTEWREAGLIMLAQQVALGGGDRSQWRMDPVLDESNGAQGVPLSCAAQPSSFARLPATLLRGLSTRMSRASCRIGPAGAQAPFPGEGATQTVLLDRPVARRARRPSREEEMPPTQLPPPKPAPQLQPAPQLPPCEPEPLAPPPEPAAQVLPLEPAAEMHRGCSDEDKVPHRRFEAELSAVISANRLRHAAKQRPTRHAPRLTKNLIANHAARSSMDSRRLRSSASILSAGSSKRLRQAHFPDRRASQLSHCHIHQHTQWDAVSSQGVGDLSHFNLVMIEQPLEPGVSGGGGVRLHVLELSADAETRAREVIAACARVWIRRVRSRHEGAAMNVATAVVIGCLSDSQYSTGSTALRAKD